MDSNMEENKFEFDTTEYVFDFNVTKHPERKSNEIWLLNIFHENEDFF